MHYRISSTLRAASLLAICLTLPHSAMRAQERSYNKQRPVQAELIASLDTGKLQQGAPVLAKVKYAWTGPGCTLHAGSTVIGYVAEIKRSTRQSKGASMTLVFNKADCGAPLSSSLSLVLFAVVAEVTVSQDNMQDRDGLFGSTSARPIQGGGLGSSQEAPPVTYRDTSLDNDMSVHSAVKKGAPNSIQAGQVVGINKVTLSVGSGTAGGSILTSSNRNFRLERTTALVLMPTASLVMAARKSSATPMSSAEAASAGEPRVAANEAPPAPPLPPPPPQPEPVDETAVCTSDCSTVSSSAATTSRVFASLPTEDFGYTAHDKREFTEFNYESALTYLDPSNLLFTFDLHRMRMRYGNTLHPDTMRVVRAVLVDASTRTVRQIVDWQVQGEGQYLWRAGAGHILVHTGHELRLLGTDLTPVRMLSVPGLLTWVASSPDGSHFAVGTLHERHSAAIHQAILDATNVEPEEDIVVRVYDRDFHLLLSTTQPSTMYPPVLADSGEIQAHPDGSHRWKVSEFRWDSTEHVIAHMNSGCRPTISTPVSGRLFVVGCDTSSAANWYRLLRLDGHTVLKDHGASQEIELAAHSSGTTGVAVRVAWTYKSLLPGSAFHTSDLRSQEISVFDVSNGKLLFTTAAPDVPPTEQSFALSPDNRQIAVLHDSSIVFYSLDDNTAGGRTITPGLQ